jgi:hypothetical protein
MAIDYSSVINNMTNAYNKTVQGYQTTLAQQQQAQQGVMQGYNSLQANVLGGLEGSSKAASQAVADQYAQQSGQAALGLTSRGLGNTTVANSVQRGIGLDEAKAQTNVANTYANTAAGYQTQVGLAGLGYAGNALNANMNFAGQGLQYQGQGAAQIGQLAQGFAGYENQAAMQQAALAQQQNLQNQQLAQQKAMQQADFLHQNQLALLGLQGRGGTGGIQYGSGGGGGSYPHDPGGSPSYANVPNPYGQTGANANAATFGYGSQTVSPYGSYVAGGGSLEGVETFGGEGNLGQGGEGADLQGVEEFG